MSDRWRQAAVIVALDEVLDDRAGLREHEVAITNHWRLSEWVQLAVRRRRPARSRFARKALNRVVEPEFLEDPEHALRARALQVINGDHLRHPQAPIPFSWVLSGRGDTVVRWEKIAALDELPRDKRR
jgi:hypothetical protein